MVESIHGRTTCFFKVDFEKSSRYGLDADTKIGKTMKVVRKAIESATNAIVDKISVGISEVNRANIRMWIREFCTHLQKSHLPISDTVLGTLGDSNITDFTKFRNAHPKTT